MSQQITMNSNQSSKNPVKLFFFALFSIGAGIFLALILVEGVLRLLPVPEICPSMFKDHPPENSVQRFLPNQNCIWSKGFTFDAVNKYRINNDGWVSALDYQPNPSPPLIAVIGDSYIEAMMVPPGQTLQERLHTKAQKQGCGSVYGFGFSGAPLSQYLMMAQYARTTYGAKKFIFVIIQNDFDESWSSFAERPALHYFVDLPGTPLQMKPRNLRAQYGFFWHFVLFKLNLSNLALIRYVHYNLPEMRHAIRQASLEPLLVRFGWQKRKTVKYVGNVLEQTSHKREIYGARASDVFFEKIASYTGADRKDILFVINGFPVRIAKGKNDNSMKNSYAGHMFSYFIAQARARNYAIIDMQPLFVDNFKKTQKTAVIMDRENQVVIDGHWSAHGHDVAAQAVQQSHLWRSLDTCRMGEPLS